MTGNAMRRADRSQRLGSTPLAVQAAKLAIGVCLSGGLAAWAFSRAALHQIAAVFASANWGLIATAFLILLAAMIVHCGRWSILIGAAGGQGHFARLLAVHFAGLLCNTVVPAQLGLDALRVQYGAPLVGGRARMMSLVVVDRVLGAASLSVLAFLACVVLGATRPSLQGFAVAPAVVLGMIGAAVAAVRLCPAAARGMVRRACVFPRIRPKVALLLAAVRADFGRSRCLLAATGCAVFQVALMGVSLAALSAALRLPIAGSQVALTLPVISLVTMIVPFTINGIGVREAMFCAVTVPLGLSPSQALSLSLAWFALSLLSTTPGIVGLLALSVQKWRTPQGSDELTPARRIQSELIRVDSSAECLR